MNCCQGSLISLCQCVLMAHNPSEVKLQLSENVKRMAYLYSPDDQFTLASGRRSSHFFDMKPVMMDPESAHLIGIMAHEILKGLGEVNAVGGLELPDEIPGSICRATCHGSCIYSASGHWYPAYRHRMPGSAAPATGVSRPPGGPGACC